MAIESIDPELLTDPTGIDRFAELKDLSPAQSFEHLWNPEDNIVINKEIKEASLEGFRTNPILDPTISGLGQVRLLKVRSTGGEKPGQPKRTHRLYTIELNGFSHAVEITDPTEGEFGFAIFSLPGFTETIENPVRKKFQSHTSYEFPTARIVSIGSNGIGTTGDRYGWNERSLHGLDAMAEQRLNLAKALAGHLPAFLMGTSMGTVISKKVAEQNHAFASADERIDLKGLYALSPAWVDPKNVLTDMGLIFIPQLTKSAFAELGLRTPPKEAWFLARSLFKYGLSRQDVVALVNQAVDLLGGTKEESLAEVFKYLPTVVVAGEHDILAQWAMQQRLERQSNGNLVLKIIKGRGHELGMKPGKSTVELARCGKFLVEEELAA